MPVSTSNPDVSSRHSATAAIIARPEGLTALGAMPAAQLIVGSAVALLPAVVDHCQTAADTGPAPIAIASRIANFKLSHFFMPALPRHLWS